MGIVSKLQVAHCCSVSLWKLIIVPHLGKNLERQYLLRLAYCRLQYLLPSDHPSELSRDNKALQFSFQTLRFPHMAFCLHANSPLPGQFFASSYCGCHNLRLTAMPVPQFFPSGGESRQKDSSFGDRRRDRQELKISTGLLHLLQNLAQNVLSEPPAAHL